MFNLVTRLQTIAIGRHGSPVRIDEPKLIRRVVINPSYGLVPHMPLVSLGGSWCFVLLRDAIVGIYLQSHRWRGSARTREIEVRLWLEKPRAIAPRVAPRLALGDATLKRRICTRWPWAIAFWRSAFESCNVLSVISVRAQAAAVARPPCPLEEMRVGSISPDVPVWRSVSSSHSPQISVAACSTG